MSELSQHAAERLMALADADRAHNMQRFFRTGEGEYGHGDRFLGIPNPLVRRLVRELWQTLSLDDAADLARSPWHEIRLFALLVMVEKYQHAKKQPDTQRHIYEKYTSLHPNINNWDLVDLTAYKIVGDYESQPGTESLMVRWIEPGHTLWQRRISMVSSFTMIRRGEYTEPLRRASTLIRTSDHDLLHKAAGWMMREVWKHPRGPRIIDTFLHDHIATIPAITLSYATEKMSPTLRRHFSLLRRLSQKSIQLKR